MFARLNVFAVVLLAVFTWSPLVKSRAEEPKAKDKKADAEPKQKPKLRELKLFNGKNLDGWKSSEFGGDGEITIEEGKLILDFGNDLTGITWKDAKVLPKINYEIALEAQRVEGSDFFCADRRLARLASF